MGIPARSAPRRGGVAPVQGGPHNPAMKNPCSARPPFGPDIAGLRAFAFEDDRLPPPAFVGRREVIADIERAVAEAAAGGAAVRGRTRLVFGAPGAGKTSLLDELARRWRARAAGGDASAPDPVDCEPGELASPVAFTEAVLSALAPGSSFDAAEATTTEGGGGLPGFVRLGVSRTASIPSLIDSVFGLVHAYFLWSGDILVTYALCGSVLFLLRNRSPRTLVISGLAVFSVASILYTATGMTTGAIPDKDAAEIVAFWAPDAAKIDAELLAYRGEWFTQQARRSTDTLVMHTMALPII